jgi:hypothetical protein
MNAVATPSNTARVLPIEVPRAEHRALPPPRRAAPEGYLKKFQTCDPRDRWVRRPWASHSLMTNTDRGTCQ